MPLPTAARRETPIDCFVRRLGRVAGTLAFSIWLALSAFAQPTAAAPAVPLPHYGLQATLDLDGNVLEARQTVRFANVTGQPLGSVVLHSMAGGMGLLSIEDARVGGERVTPQIDASGSVIELPLAAPAAPGQMVELSLTWTERIPRTPDRLSSAGGVVSLGNWFPTLGVFRGDWDRRPYTQVGDAFFTEASDFDVQLDLSRPATVAFTGDLVRHDESRWEMAAHSVRDFAMAVSDAYVEASDTMPNGLLVSVYALSAEHAQTYLDGARQFITAYEQLVGPYPYGTVRVAETPLPASYAGMEYPQIVFLASALSVQDFRASEARNVLAHELAHQWFYGLLGDDQIADPWLDEAFATHLAVLGYEVLTPDLATREASLRQAPTGPGPWIDQGVFDFPNDGPYFQAVYRRGSRFLAELRDTMGDGAWKSFLRQLYATYVGKVETPRAVLDLAQRTAPSANLGPVISTYTRYGAFTYPQPRTWSVTAPPGPLAGQVTVGVEASFPTTGMEIWLDDWQVASADRVGPATFDVNPIPAGDYVLLVRVTDEQGAVFERASRVQVAP